ncbi:winged helix-turn-helix transcriptional regulator [Sphingobacterium rhinopitheci]|uniref:winged helix-turn-helix transcriptional regulator n=1 Tax=Sphingobacterium rhinopitheci TaxID=2781960 RepID=UPI001F516437|nr:helix-turn-helix domain-containing protein [Sphingobacterium rhinopitheci]MCI0922785.1 helix-turn-helix transcriptional regulator [Sphingobacterium rhinopitheci]
MKKYSIPISEQCKSSLKGIEDVQEIMGGKWKYLIVSTLFFLGKLKFMELCRQIDKISPKVLSKELKDLEINQLVTRTICDTKPITVEYELTNLGESLHTIIIEMGKWGIAYRESILK